MKIDLHSHSTASDGTDSPAALVLAAAHVGLDVLAITDHDTTAGWAEAQEAVRLLDRSLIVVPGMEMSCTGRGEGGRLVSVHLLAYLFEPHSPVFAEETVRLQSERIARMQKMTIMMAADGIPINPEEVMNSAQGVIGRPHLAAALVNAGVVDSVDEAFRGLLSADSRYVLPKRDTPLTVAVEMVRAAGGVPVLAHPKARSRGGVLDTEHIEEAVEAGLAGIEVDHMDHNADDRKALLDLAKGLNLIVTGSSDYHGSHKRVELGQYRTHPSQWEKIQEMATGVSVLESGYST
ncbi:MAG: PHP domain-containing protein [Mycobacteriaceae bacterium]